MKKEKIDFIDWFSPFNLEHIRAYEYWLTVGKWPEDFREKVPSNIIVYNDFSSHIDRKIAQQWMNHLLSFEKVGDDKKNPQRKGMKK